MKFRFRHLVAIFVSSFLFACTQPTIKLAESENSAKNEAKESEKFVIEKIARNKVEVRFDIGKVREMLQEKNPSFNYTLHEVNIKKVSENHAFGGVQLPDGPGNFWLATKINNEWQIVWMGSDVPDCSVIKKYNFPNSIVEDCYDFEIQKTIKNE